MGYFFLYIDCAVHTVSDVYFVSTVIRSLHPKQKFTYGKQLIRMSADIQTLLFSSSIYIEWRYNV